MLVAWISLRSGPARVLSVLLFAFAGSFVVAFGWYLRLTPGGFLIGAGNLVYLLAALFAAGAWLAQIGTRLGGDLPRSSPATPA